MARTFVCKCKKIETVDSENGNYSLADAARKKGWVIPISEKNEGTCPDCAQRSK